MKIGIFGLGYVGTSLALVLSQENNVTVYDIIHEKIKNINSSKTLIEYKNKYNSSINNELKLRGVFNYKDAIIDQDFIIIAISTNYNKDTGKLDTSSIEKIIKKVIKFNKNTTIIIKSTVRIGFTDEMRKKYKFDKIIFSPEFLREDKAIQDVLNPSRIVIGDSSDEAKTFIRLLNKCSDNKNIEIIYTTNSSAEAIKLFSNAYLAMRISFFNELDTFAEVNKLNAKDIIEGVGLDPRIGRFYNNPSFGYGGYCLPKDTKQLVNDYGEIHNDIMSAIVKSNESRKLHIVEMIKNRKIKKIGIYRLIMKSNSDNIRSSAILDIIEELNKYRLEIVVYEPLLENKLYIPVKYENDLNKFINMCDLIIANRIDDNIKFFEQKIYSRDLYFRD